MTTTVISLKGRIHDYGPRLECAPDTLIYVGRAQTMGGWRLPAHPLANPHTTRPTGCPAPGCGFRHDQAGAVRAYALELQADEQRRHHGQDRGLFAQVREASGATLACWCPPRICHTDVIAAVADAPGDVEAIRVLDALADDPLKVLRPLDSDDVTHAFLVRIEGTMCDRCEAGAEYEVRLSRASWTVCGRHLPGVEEWAVAEFGRPVVFHDTTT